LAKTRIFARIAAFFLKNAVFRPDKMVLSVCRGVLSAGGSVSAVGADILSANQSAAEGAKAPGTAAVAAALVLGCWFLEIK
jgi:hypothetical protein